MSAAQAKRVLTAMVFAAVALSPVGPATAGTLAFQDGETQPHVNWRIVSALSGTDLGSPAAAQVVGGHPNALSVPSTSEIFPAYDFVFNESGLTGNYLDLGGGGTPVRSISADLYSNMDVGSAASDSRLYMRAGGFVWYCDVGPAPSGWRTIESNLRHQDDDALFGWYSEQGRSSAQFYADIGSVDRIGVELSYLPGREGLVYGIDAFTLSDVYAVPEPPAPILFCVGILLAAAASKPWRRRLQPPPAGRGV